MKTPSLEVSRRRNMEHYGFGPDAMKTIRVCSHCGDPAPAERRFCAACGQRLPEKTLYEQYLERHRRCFSCNTILAEEMEFCPQCGKKTEV